MIWQVKAKKELNILDGQHNDDVTCFSMNE